MKALHKIMPAKAIYFIVSLSLLLSIDSHGGTIDSLTYNQKLNSGEYYPYFKSDSATLYPYPFHISIGIEVQKLEGLDIKNQDFYIGFNINTITPDTVDFNSNGDTLTNLEDPFDFFYPEYPEHDRTYPPRWGDPWVNFNDSLKLDWFAYMETVLPHVWDMKDYPFDQQKLKIIFNGIEDTSQIKLVAEDSLNYVNDDILMFIKDGFNVSHISSVNHYVEVPDTRNNFVGGERLKIIQMLIFEINLERSGSYLYFKLFFGGFLSFLISFLVFTISPRLFETRITLSLGGIFGAVGNKYFVENVMPNIQVLTKADLINNLVIMFIILNIFIVIGQQTKSIPLGKFEKNAFAAKAILILFILTNLIIVYT